MKNEIRVISAIVNGREIAPVLNCSNVDSLFDSYKDVWEYIRDYYYKHREVVSKEVILEAFPEMEIIDTTGTVKHYLEQLTKDYQRTRLEKISRGLARDLDNKPLESLIDAVQGRLLEIINVGSSVKDLDITDDKKAVDHYIDTRAKMEANGGVLGIRTGYDSIDANYVTGMAPGQYIAILSRTGMGKSWLALDIAINAWIQGKRVLYISLEMPPEAVRDRAYTLMSEGLFSMSDLSRANVNLDQITKWAADKLRDDRSFIVTASDSMGDFSPSHIQGKIDQYGPDIVFVDYLQLMTDKRNSSGETERVRNASKEIKSIAMTNGIPIVVVAAASSHETKEYNSPPQIYECAASRMAVFDVDLLLSLISQRNQDGSHLMTIVSRKSRHGPDFGFMISMDIPNGKISELWKEPEEDTGLIDEE